MIPIVPAATPAASPTFAVDVLRHQVATLQGRLGDAVSQAREARQECAQLRSELCELRHYVHARLVPRIAARFAELPPPRSRS